MEIFFIGVGLLFLSGILARFITLSKKIPFVFVMSLVSTILCLCVSVPVLFGAQDLIAELSFNNIFGLVKFVIDPLSAFFIFVISVMSLLGVGYSKGYLQKYMESGKCIDSHLIFFTTLVASMLLVVTCQNALAFLICWELMSLSSFFLVIFESEKKPILKAGIKYLVFMHISVLFIIMAFALASIETGSFDFSSYVEFFEKNQLFANTIFLLAFVGFGTKAGFVPFHNWLPDAHPAAPSHVSAVMSGVMIKTGIYGILRILSLMSVPSITVSYIVLTVSLVTAFYGALYSISQQDIKRLLAYCSIENIGVIGIGVGTGMLGLAYNNSSVAVLGFLGAILHILNHSIFKEILFFGAGAVYKKTHTRDIELLGGLIKKMPLTAIFFLCASVAVCALPPFNGFISEFLIYFGMFKGLGINNFYAVVTFLFAIAGLAIVGTMAMLAFTKTFSIVFLGTPRSDAAENVREDVDWTMWLPMGLLVLVMLFIGVCPQNFVKLVQKPIELFVQNTSFEILLPLEILQHIAGFMLIFVVFVSVLAWLKLRFSDKVNAHETWGCGYNKLNPHIQYTASSYASPFLVMLKPLFKNVFNIEKPKKMFPKNAHFSMHFDDIEEAYVIHPLVKFDEWFLSKFEKLQSGNLQSYIKYGLLFLILVLIGCLLIK